MTRLALMMGNMTASPRTAHPYDVQDSSCPTCPRCDNVLRRVTPVLGSLLVTCDNKLDRRPGESERRTCGQHIHILGAPEGVCIVVPITRDKFEEARVAGVRVSRDHYAEWGVTRGRP